MKVNSGQPINEYFKAVQYSNNARGTQDQSQLTSIKNILVLGKKLGIDQMNYLQRQDPNLYNQAIKEEHSEFMRSSKYASLR